MAVQRTGASRYAEWRGGRARWLAPVADLCVGQIPPMKTSVTVAVSFFCGALLASGAWAFYAFKKQAELSIYYVTMLHGQATISEDMLLFLENRGSTLTNRLTFAASNAIVYFPRDIAAWDTEYPYLRLKDRYASESKRFEQFMRDRQARMNAQSATTAQ